MQGPFKVHQDNVVVMEFRDSDLTAVVAIATTAAIAEEIVEGLNHKYLEKVMAGE